MAKRIPFTPELHAEHPDWLVYYESRRAVMVFDGRPYGRSLRPWLCVLADGDFGAVDACNLELVAPTGKRVTSWHRVIPRDSDYLSGGWETEAQARFGVHDEYPVIRIVREQQPDGTWIILGTRELEAEEASGHEA